MRFTIVLTRDEDDPKVFNASVPALPGCYSYGRGKREAYKRAREAIDCYLESLRNHGDPVPEEAGTMEVEVA
jgi:predicted RNase H-like HicB family nuclease